MGEKTELGFAKSAMVSQIFHKIVDVLFKAEGPAVDVGRVKEIVHEILKAINLFESDTVLSLYTLWLAERLSPPCSDESWQQTLQLLLNAITEAWRLSGASTSPSLPTAPKEPPMLLEIQGLLRMGKVHEN